MTEQGVAATESFEPDNHGAGNSAASRDKAYFLHPYTNLHAHETQGPLIIERGEGVRVFDDSGKEYIEGLASLWCVSLGWGEERLVEAATRQMRKLPTYHVFGHKSHEPGIDLAERLIKLAPVPMSKVFFANSGSEANDTAVKLVWYYNNALGRPEKKKILSRVKAYHGVTVATASLTGLVNNHRDFDLPIARIQHTDCPHHYRFAEPGESEEDFATRLAESLEALILAEGPETIAAMFAEPVMGAGGVIVPPATYFAKIQPILKKYDILLVADEVICGFGRTGNFWGSQTMGMQPDILTCAKQLSSGYLPISAVMVSDAVYRACVEESKKIGTFGHGYTYSAHPVAAAVAIETLKIYEERDLVGHVRAVAPLFQRRLKALADHPLVGEARGVGLIGALELVADKETKTPFDPVGRAGAVVNGLSQENGLIIRAMGDSVAVCPPLVIGEEDINRMFDRLTTALDAAIPVLRG
ncbi:aspartate aminotransferase family protein [Azospirillum baldaniorum]|uniref:Aminotransferase n=1 Tax=Azospirillum baldaniorum TaxID=1064539 RepID=A0A9P1JNZ8_9PROT|nr:aspartate aminotransferase family protein [Azospirillum baldaniorum]TWA78958.1 4-aminobutyrate--pyruvate transaminase [Azospirillum brasilense]AWJ90730.1 aspartate aminotransferase family protein [Azospirillum baldaniorum]NUB08771.1 aspartate aminotransferase family protein [Azospirillum baldaniorum]TWA69545.1 4-aminobutyrate--pyruvate transaminase [Azospirillum baldaniorum]CCC97045.1 putative aminotransferase [Azospirillum baldaniorum]